MRTVFCKEELDLANGIPSFSKEQLAICENITTVICYDTGKIVNDQRRRYIVFIMEKFILWWNILMQALGQDLNWKKNTCDKKRNEPLRKTSYGKLFYVKGLCVMARSELKEKQI